MKTFEQDFKTNPTFNSIVGLSNTTYDNTNIRSGQMATEDQILQLFNDAADLKSRINYCCRDIVMWKTYIRIVEEKTGIVVSDFFDNMASGMTKRGMPFTVEFARVFDESKFIMDRSVSDRVGSDYKNFKIVTTGMNTSHRANTKEIEDRLTLMLNDYYENTSVSDSAVNYHWPFSLPSQYGSGGEPSTILYVTSIVSNYRFLPQTVNKRDNLYHVYKDLTDNKIKIDIMGKNQFEYNITSTPIKAYDTVFVTQWVLKQGASL